MRRFGRWISAQWWALLEKVGFGKERWLAVDPSARKAFKTVFWVVVGLILIAVGGVWNSSALIAAAIVIAVLIIPWRRLPFGQWLVPLVFLVLAVLYPSYYTHLFGSPIFGPAPAW